jgi:hypothetical protein
VSYYLTPSLELSSWRRLLVQQLEWYLPFNDIAFCPSLYECVPRAFPHPTSSQCTSESLAMHVSLRSFRNGMLSNSTYEPANPSSFLNTIVTSSSTLPHRRLYRQFNPILSLRLLCTYSTASPALILMPSHLFTHVHLIQASYPVASASLTPTPRFVLLRAIPVRATHTYLHVRVDAQCHHPILQALVTQPPKIISPHTTPTRCAAHHHRPSIPAARQATRLAPPTPAAASPAKSPHQAP